MLIAATLRPLSLSLSLSFAHFTLAPEPESHGRCQIDELGRGLERRA